MNTTPIDAIRGDFTDHLSRLEIFIEHWNNDSENQGNRIKPNRQGLYLAVKSAHDDISRYKSYHLSDPRNGIANSVKMAAYLCKWICRFKVIESAGPGTGSEPSLAEPFREDVTSTLMNGRFALFLGRTLIGAELREPFSFIETYAAEFEYDLLYRELGEAGLLHIFQMIFSAVRIRRAGVLDFEDQGMVASIFCDPA